MSGKEISLEEYKELIKELEESGELPVIDKNNDYDDFMKLGNDIIEHIRNNPDAKIIQKDDPLRLRIGYKDESSDKTWFIKITELRKSINNLNPDQKDILQRAFMTQEGKQNLIEMWYGKGKEK